jgi:hypothetical protein
MRCLFRGLRGRVLSPWMLLLTFALPVLSCTHDATEPTDTAPPNLAAVGAEPPGLAQALAAQARHTDRLLRTEGVVGTAIGLAPNGRAAVQIFTKTAGVRGLPISLDRVPVSAVVTGEIRAIAASAAAPAAAALSINPKSRFPRPVPIGISTGNKGQCSAGTIGFRGKSGTAVYAVSNNHVYALENSAPIGSKVLQPGRYDLACASGSDAIIGSLSKFVRIVFSTTANNKVDAAMAISSTANLGRRTPSDGYGVPSSAIIAASLNQPVQKYGRTTGRTTGAVVGINATVNVGYSHGTARFVGQVVVRGPGQFSRAGDSGSLIVTNNSSKRPVGLLFAGSSDGYTIANPIGAVLNALGVTIDGT